MFKLRHRVSTIFDADNKSWKKCFGISMENLIFGRTAKLAAAHLEFLPATFDQLPSQCLLRQLKRSCFSECSTASLQNRTPTLVPDYSQRLCSITITLIGWFTSMIFGPGLSLGTRTSMFLWMMSWKKCVENNLVL